MTELIVGLMEKYGVQASFPSRSDLAATKVFFQLITSKSWQNMERMVPTGGEIPRGQYLLIAPANTALQPADRIQVHGHNYVIRRVDVIHFKDAPLFIWGLCVEGGAQDPWTN